MLNESFTKPSRFPEKDLKDVKNYLNSIKFDERLEERKVTAIEMKEILLEHLKKYFQGKISLDFIFGLSDEIGEVWWEATESEENDVLGTVACELGYLPSTASPKTSEKIEKILRWVFEVLEKDLSKRS